MRFSGERRRQTRNSNSNVPILLHRRRRGRGPPGSSPTRPGKWATTPQQHGNLQPVTNTPFRWPATGPAVAPVPANLAQACRLVGTDLTAAPCLLRAFPKPWWSLRRAPRSDHATDDPWLVGVGTPETDTFVFGVNAAQPVADTTATI